MSILKIWVAWFYTAWMPLYMGGASSADNSQTVKNETQDKRIAAAANSTNLGAIQLQSGDIGTEGDAAGAAWFVVSDTAATALQIMGLS
jgi:hypothetical protein